MSHFTCDRANCPKWKEKSSSKSSSIDDFDKADLVNRETQMSNSTIRESSSDKTFVAPTFQFVCNQTETQSHTNVPEEDVPGDSIKMLLDTQKKLTIDKSSQTCSEPLSNMEYQPATCSCIEPVKLEKAPESEGSETCSLPPPPPPPPPLSEKLTCSCGKEKITKEEGHICSCQEMSSVEPIYLEIPLEIRLRVRTKYLKVSKYTSTEPEVCLKCGCKSLCTQTGDVHLFDCGYMPQCWCSMQKPHKMLLDTQKKLTIDKSSQTCPEPLSNMEYQPATCSCIEPVKLEKAPELEESETCSLPPPPTPPPSPLSEKLTCSCGKEKITKEEYDKMMLDPTSKLSMLICERSKKCTCDWNIPKPVEDVAAKPPEKMFRLAYPQKKDLDLCINCRFDPSPLIDEEGNIICPGNCGCCLCPWKPRASRSLEDVLRHSKVKVCKCRYRDTVFTGMTRYDSSCSQVSYFDVCPCREKAEAKHLTLYGYEMFDNSGKLSNKFRGELVSLNDVKELNVKELKAKQVL